MRFTENAPNKIVEKELQKNNPQTFERAAYYIYIIYFKLSQKEPFIKISLLHTTTDVIHLDGVNLHFQLFKNVSKEFFCKDIQSFELTFDQKLARKCKKFFSYLK